MFFMSLRVMLLYDLQTLTENRQAKCTALCSYISNYVPAEKFTLMNFFRINHLLRVNLTKKVIKRVMIFIKPLTA